MKTPSGSGVVTIDVAHPPMSADDAEAALDDLLRKSILGDRTHVIRVIHGFGSGGRGGSLKNAVRNWAYRRREKIGMVIPGEEYSPFMSEIQDFLKDTEGVRVADFSDASEGMTFLLLE